jgi:MYXO-CTERM domain-containing protein
MRPAAGPSRTRPTRCRSPRRGANLIVPIAADDYWNSPSTPSNLSTILGWSDNNCTGSTELFGDPLAKNPMGGMLQDMYRYFTVGWTNPASGVVTPSPLGTSAQGERSCRAINVILITAGDEGCDQIPGTVAGVAINAAAALNAGFTVGGITWVPKVYVINFSQGGLIPAVTDAIAQAGGTGASYVANNETQLAQAFSNIISSSVGPEVCDNGDNNCNGCTDEGYTHYCNQGQTCCAWVTDPERLACISSYTQSITPANPGGNLALLPCTTPADQADPLHWLCYDPKETCDNVDNNCSGVVDENTLTCGNPAHCPSMEICDATDNDCDGQTDEGAVCNNVCLVAPTPEICDGCDNDCDGIVDEGIVPIACGALSPMNCAGTATCTFSGQAVGQPGACLAGGGFGACSNSPQAEICDGIDNNCNGVIDDGIPPILCVPAGQPANLDYGVNSQCKQGTQKCGGQCIGFVGPSTEVCDGIDNDCDGQVDESPFGVGQPCGFNAPPCSPGMTACVNGAIVCQGGVNPQSEVCDGIDNDCDGTADEIPLSDAPPAGQNGCWNLPGGNCVFQNLGWNPPAGGSCTGNGSLTPPCNHGTLACAGAQGWTCVGSNTPAAESCDGIDNDCNGSVDDGNLPQVGQICGTDVGECSPGTVQCAAGVLDCLGDVSPTPEVCNGLDDDCDSVIDNGVAGATCDPVYDASVYPGDRSHLPCKQGVTQCTQDGQSICVGAVGPSPEVCNGVDDDCDGSVDETAGVGPDSIAGSANPNPPPAVNIGDACGQSEGICEPGTYQCVLGTVVCQGQTDPVAEECDCQDNDCNGVQDNENADGTPLCSEGKTCVESAFGCQCAQKCDGEVQPCPGGQTCVAVDKSETGEFLGTYCVQDPCPNNCFNAKVSDAAGNTLCGPAGTPPEQGCLPIPECACADAAGCQAPCYGVTCDQGLACTNYGATPGTCVALNCFNFPCENCDEVCGPAGQCLPNPCKPESCPGQTCKPSDDYTTAICVPSCADVECESGQICQDGACVDDCDPCAAGSVCDHGSDPATCVDDACDPDNPCTDGSYCDPLSGSCGPDPCDGVICPGTQVCFEGDCYLEAPTGSSGTTTGAGGGGATSSSAAGGGSAPRGIWGLATGGGGCSCETAGSNPDGSGQLAFATLGLALAALRRRNRRTGSAAKEVR